MLYAGPIKSRVVGPIWVSICLDVVKLLCLIRPILGVILPLTLSDSCLISPSRVNLILTNFLVPRSHAKRLKMDNSGIKKHLLCMELL